MTTCPAEEVTRVIVVQLPCLGTRDNCVGILPRQNLRYLVEPAAVTGKCAELPRAGNRRHTLCKRFRAAGGLSRRPWTSGDMAITVNVRRKIVGDR